METFLRTRIEKHFIMDRIQTVYNTYLQNNQTNCLCMHLQNTMIVVLIMSKWEIKKEMIMYTLLWYTNIAKN